MGFIRDASSFVTFGYVQDTETKKWSGIKEEVAKNKELDDPKKLFIAMIEVAKNIIPPMKEVVKNMADNPERGEGYGTAFRESIKNRVDAIKE